jgi:hypothetical protein
MVHDLDERVRLAAFAFLDALQTRGTHLLAPTLNDVDLHHDPIGRQ